MSTADKLTDEELKQENKQLKEQLEQIRAVLAVKDEAVRSLQAAKGLGGSLTDAGKLRELEDCLQKVEKLQKENEQTKKKLRVTVSERVTRLEKTIAQKQKFVQELTRENKRLVASQRTLTRTIERQELVEDEWKQKLRAAEEELQLFHGKVAKLLEQEEHYAKSRQQGEEEIVKLKKQIEQVQAEIDAHNNAARRSPPAKTGLKDIRENTLLSLKQRVELLQNIKRGLEKSEAQTQVSLRRVARMQNKAKKGLDDELGFIEKKERDLRRQIAGIEATNLQMRKDIALGKIASFFDPQKSKTRREQKDLKRVLGIGGTN